MYKEFVVVAFVLLAQAAHAENFYNCKIDYLAKFANGAQQIKPRANVVLSDTRASNIQLPDSSDTVLTMTVDQDQKLVGSMNRDYYEINGGIQNGSFFVKFHRPYQKVTYSGSIECGSAEKVDVAFLRKSDKKLIRERYPLEIPVNFRLYCLIGSADKAEALVKAGAPSVVNTEVTKAGLSVTVMEKRCEQSSGSYEDYECHKYGPVTQATYTLEKCDRPDLDDPR